MIVENGKLCKSVFKWITLNIINYSKPINRRGSISGNLYFDGLELKKVDKLNLLTEELLVSAGLQFKSDSQLESIFVDRFIKDKNNFQAKYNLKRWIRLF